MHICFHYLNKKLRFDPVEIFGSRDFDPTAACKQQRFTYAHPKNWYTFFKTKKYHTCSCLSPKSQLTLSKFNMKLENMVCKAGWNLLFLMVAIFRSSHSWNTLGIFGGMLETSQFIILRLTSGNPTCSASSVTSAASESILTTSMALGSTTFSTSWKPSLFVGVQGVRWVRWVKVQAINKQVGPVECDTHISWTCGVDNHTVRERKEMVWTVLIGNSWKVMSSKYLDSSGTL